MLSDVYKKPFKLGDPGFINPRGTNGTGKSTIIRKYLTPDAQLKHFDDLNCHYYDCGTHFIVGKYESDCGGLDGVRGTADKKKGIEGYMPYEAGQIAIMRLSKIKTTFGEGLIYGTTFQGSREVYDDLHAAGVPYFWFSINITPEEVFNSVLSRRVKNGNLEPLNTHNVGSKFRPVLASHNKAVDHGIWALCGDRVEVAENIERLLVGQVPTKDIGEKYDLLAVRDLMAPWMAMGEVKPTAEMIEALAPKQTTTGLMGFFQ